MTAALFGVDAPHVIVAASGARVPATFGGTPGAFVSPPSVMTHWSSPTKAALAAAGAPPVYLLEPASNVTAGLTVWAAQDCSSAS